MSNRLLVCWDDDGRRTCPKAGPPRLRTYGFVVESVKVSVFEYEPVRSASVELIFCANCSDTSSLETGPS